MIRNEMIKEEILKKLNLFKDTKTYTFFKVRYSTGFRIYNGSILNITDSYVMILDKKIGKFPIEINDIISVDVSQEKNGGNNGR